MKMASLSSGPARIRRHSTGVCGLLRMTGPYCSLALLLLGLLQTAKAAVIGIDMGSEYMKVSLLARSTMT